MDCVGEVSPPVTVSVISRLMLSIVNVKLDHELIGTFCDVPRSTLFVTKDPEATNSIIKAIDFPLWPQLQVEAQNPSHGNHVPAPSASLPVAVK